MDGAAPAEARVTGPFHPRSLAQLQAALDWWQAQGFAYVDLPWLVPAEFSDATRPASCRDITTPQGSFVASGEQSFLYLWANQRLPDALGHIGWTPCLRDEPVLDALHQHGFMKAEVFVALASNQAEQAWFDQLADLVQAQANLFHTLAPDAGPVQQDITGPESVDLCLGGLEIGSYGLRTFRGRPYLYGTALALPRFTLAVRAALAGAR